MKDKLKGKEKDILERFEKGETVKNLSIEYDVKPPSMRHFLNKNGISTSRKIPNYIGVLDVEDAAYIAGIIDGEGYIGAREVKSRNTMSVQSVLVIGTTSLELVEYLKSKISAGSIRNVRRETKKKWKTLYYWYISSLGGTQLLRQILPYMRIKKEQATLFIELAEIKSKSAPRKRFMEDRQVEIVKKFKELNRRGIE